jgi:hypothetical protein
MPCVINHKLPLKSLDLSKIVPFSEPRLQVSQFCDPCCREFLSLQPMKPKYRISMHFAEDGFPMEFFTSSGFQTSRLHESGCKAPVPSTSKTPKWSTRFDSTYLTKTCHLSTQIISISDVDSRHLSLFPAFGT